MSFSRDCSRRQVKPMAQHFREADGRMEISTPIPKDASAYSGKQSQLQTVITSKSIYSILDQLEHIIQCIHLDNAFSFFYNMVTVFFGTLRRVYWLAASSLLEMFFGAVLPLRVCCAFFVLKKNLHKEKEAEATSSRLFLHR